MSARRYRINGRKLGASYGWRIASNYSLRAECERAATAYAAQGYEVTIEPYEAEDEEDEDDVEGGAS